MVIDHERPVATHPRKRPPSSAPKYIATVIHL
jgi:hypothetical protein